MLFRTANFHLHFPKKKNLDFYLGWKHADQNYLPIGLIWSIFLFNDLAHRYQKHDLIEAKQTAHLNRSISLTVLGTTPEIYAGLSGETTRLSFFAHKGTLQLKYQYLASYKLMIKISLIRFGKIYHCSAAISLAIILHNKVYTELYHSKLSIRHCFEGLSGVSSVTAGCIFYWNERENPTQIMCFFSGVLSLTTVCLNNEHWTVET